MSSRGLVPYGHGRETTRDLVSYESGRVSFRPPRELTRDSRAHQTTAHGQTSHRDYYPSERESYRSRRESKRDSSQSTIRAQTSRHDSYSCGSEVISIRPGRESTQDSRSRQTTTSAYPSAQGHSPHRTSARRNSRADTEYSVPKGVAERLWQLDEAYYKNDGKTVTQRARYSNLAGNSTTEFEIHETPTSLTRIRHRVTHRSHRTPDVHSKNDASRDHNPDRTGGTRNPTATGSSRHHDNTYRVRRDTLTSSRDTTHRTAGGHKPIYEESSRSTRR